MGRGGGGCYTGRDAVTGELNARRRTFEKVREPPYAASEVPKCNKALEGSVILAPPSRACWFHSITEMLLLCNEAANRFAKQYPLAKKTDADGVQSKPLGLEYMADRLDTDDPIWGYMIRREREGWLQGFITLTKFTTWHKDFEWNSLVREAAISDEEKRTRVWDSDNSLATELQAQERNGNPDEEGIIWSRVAEVSLLGALGCGSQLIQLVLDELEKGDQYDYVVLQATENAIGFYEHMGFRRVGAIAAPDQEAMAEQAALASARAEARAREREKERDAKRSNKREKQNFREMQASYAVLQHMKVWTDVAKALCGRLAERFTASSIRSWCPEVGTLLTELECFLSDRSQSEVTLDQVQCMTGTQHVVSSLWACLAGRDLARPSEVQQECTGLLEGFCRDWKALHRPDGRSAAEDDANAAESKVQGAGGGGGESTFFVHVDAEWQYRHGFKVYEVLRGAEERGPALKNTVLAREWVPSKDAELVRGFDPARVVFAPKSAKPCKLCWTPRRNLDGERQTEILPVEVTRETLHPEQGQQGGGELVCVEEQSLKVALAYVKLFAVRSIEAKERGDEAASKAGKAEKPARQAGSSGGDAEGEGAEDAMDVEEGGAGSSGSEDGEEVSAYEQARQRRIRENQSILLQSGILQASQQVSCAAERSNLPPSARAQVPAKRSREEREGGEQPTRVMRARGCKAEVGESPGGEGRAGRLDSSVLSETETPVKRTEEEGGEATPLLFPGSDAKVGGAEAESVPALCEGQAGRAPFPEDGLYVASENETPRGVARKFGVDAGSLVQMNKGDYAGLQLNSRLRRGTLLRLPPPGEQVVFVPSSKLPQKGGGWSAYCHWTFPDQEVEELFPSYMMARRLNRGPDREPNPVVAHLRERICKIPPPIRSCKEVEEMEAQEMVLAEAERIAVERKEGMAGPALGVEWPKDNLYTCAENERVIAIAKKFLVNEDQLVSLNKAAYPALNKTAPLRQGTILKLPPPLIDDASLLDGCRGPWFEPCLSLVRKVKASRHSSPFLEPVDWEALNLPDYPFLVSNPMDLETVEAKLISHKFSSPIQFAADMRLVFKNAMVFNEAEDPVYQMANKCLSSFESLWTASKLEQMKPAASKHVGAAKTKNMYNKVVTVEGKPGYFFVLHYIPDMQWCHLAEMAQYGVFPEMQKGGKPHPQAGQPCWKLKPEGEGEELDVSAERCTVVKVTTVNKVQDADREAWVIHDSAAPASTASPSVLGIPPKSVATTKGDSAPSGAPSWQTRGDEMLRTLTKNQQKAQHFMQLMDVAAPEAVRYYQQIEKPVDLATVWKKLLAGNYAAGTAFIAELELVFKNAMTFYERGSETHDSAVELHGQLEKLCMRSTVLRAFFYELHPDFKPPPTKKTCDKANAGALTQQQQQQHEQQPRQQEKAIASKPQATQAQQNATAEPSDEEELLAFFEVDPTDPLDTPEAEALREAQAMLVQAPSRTNVGKVSSSLLAKIAEHQTGKIMKVTNILPHADLEKLIKALESNRSTTRLDLEGCGAGDYGCGLVGELLRANKRIAEIDLQMNQVSDAGAQELARAMVGSGLRELNLGNNDVKREGVRALVEGVLEQGKVTGVMAKLVGLPEATVGRVRKELAAAWRQEIRRQTEGEEEDMDGVADISRSAEKPDDMIVEPDACRGSALAPIVVDCEELIAQEDSQLGTAGQDDRHLDEPVAMPECERGCPVQSGDDCCSFSPEMSVPDESAPLSGSSNSDETTDLAERESSTTTLGHGEDCKAWDAPMPMDVELAACGLPPLNIPKPLAAQICCDEKPARPQPLKKAGASRMLWKAECHGLLRRLAKHPKAWPFLEPVDPFEAEAPDYFSVIKRPMDLGTVQHKLDGGEYSGPAGLLSDVELTFRNAMRYNPEGSSVHELAVAMRGVLEILCRESASLSPALQKARDRVQLRMEQEAAQSTPDVPTAEMVALREAQAIQVPAPSKTTVGKASDSIVSKALAHQTGKIMKVTNILPHADLEKLIKALESNRSTTRLDLEGCGAGDYGCGLVGELLRANKRIAEIDLQMNQVSDAGAQELARAMVGSGLRELNLGNNDVKREGVRALVEGVLEQGKVTGVMAKLVGLPEATVGRVRKELAAAWREEAVRKSSEEPTEVFEEDVEMGEATEDVSQAQGDQSVASEPQATAQHIDASFQAPKQDDTLPTSDEGPTPSAQERASEMLWKAECHGLLRRLAKHPKAWPFLEPVDPFEAEAPDYFSVIKRPMDLGTVQHKLDGGEYSGPAGLLSDVELTFRNATRYNPEGSSVHELAVAVRGACEALCNGSRSLAAALESVRQQEASSEGAGGEESEEDNKLSTDAQEKSPEADAVRAANALLVVGPSRTTVNKVTATLLNKVENHQTGKIMKVTNILPQHDLKRLLQALESNRSTTRLDLEGCGAGDYGCGLVGELLRANKRIAEIDLQMNQVSDAGAQELARAMVGSGLRELNLGNNDVKREGVRALVEGVLEQGKVTGVMAKLVGLPEEMVASARSQLAVVYREAALRQRSAVAPAADVEGADVESMDSPAKGGSCGADVVCSDGGERGQGEGTPSDKGQECASGEALQSPSASGFSPEGLLLS